MRKTLHRSLAAAAVVTVAIGVLHGCAAAPANDDVSDRAAAIMKSSFKARGQAGLDRLDQDETQRLCSEYAGRPLPPPAAERIRESNLASTIHPCTRGRS